MCMEGQDGRWLSKVDKLEPQVLCVATFSRASEGGTSLSQTTFPPEPLRKWTDLTVKGKILSDIIATIVILMLRKETTPLDRAISEYLGKLGSITCFKSSVNRLTVSRANKQAAKFMQAVGILMPSCVSLEHYKDMVAPTCPSV